MKKIGIFTILCVFPVDSFPFRHYTIIMCGCFSQVERPRSAVFRQSELPHRQIAVGEFFKEKPETDAHQPVSPACGRRLAESKSAERLASVFFEATSS